MARPRAGTPAAAATSGSTDANSNGSRDEREHCQCRNGDDDERSYLRGRDAQEGPEQQAVDPTEVAFVERGEQEAARQRERLDDGDHGRLLTEPSTPLCRHRGDHQRAADAKGEEAELRRQPDEHGAGRARKADERKRVARERLAAQHHEPPHGARKERDHGAGAERVDHELELEEIADDVHGRRGGRGGAREPPAARRRPAAHPMRAGLRSGCDTGS